MSDPEVNGPVTTEPGDGFDFLLPDDPPVVPPRVAGAPWYVLVVDDDESVHSISRVVLADVQFRGRPVELLSAFSARGAAAMLRERGDIAVALLDVVMEQDDAGLRLVRSIREDIGNTNLRIILRTGQPGEAPERQVIVDYDINDYKSKAELTAQKLFTSTIAALRSYADIVALDTSRRGLEHIIGHAPHLFSRRELAAFARALLAEVATLLVVPGDGAVIAQPAHDADGLALGLPEDAVPPSAVEAGVVVAGTGRFADAIGQPASAVLDAALAPQVMAAMAIGAAHTDERLVIRPIRSGIGRSGAVLFLADTPLGSDQVALVDILCASVGVGLDNVHLHRRLLNHQAALEATVEQRTRELGVANRELLATQTQLQEELRVAGTLQQSILPAAFPAHPRVAGAAVMRAARAIGGDFYDVFQLDAHRIGMVVADVSGKGVPAALFMVLARTLFQDVAERGLSPGSALAETNRLLIARNPLSLFVTMLYGILDARTGRLDFASGGHGMPYVVRGDGIAGVLPGRPSPIVGLVETARFADHAVDLGPGDTVVLVTDGVQEANDAADAMFGEARFLASLAGMAATPQGLVDRVLAAVDSFTGGVPASDDLTCLVARWDGQCRLS